MTPDERARLIVDKFFEKYTPDELQEMSTVDLADALITTISELTLDEDLLYDIVTHTLIGESSHEKEEDSLYDIFTRHSMSRLSHEKGVDYE